MIQENTGPKYSEMLIQLVEEFDELLPNELTFEETLEVGIEAWNLANNKDFLVSKGLYKKELENFKNRSIIEKMVDFKIDKFPESNNVIVDYSTTNNILQVKTQTQENRFNSLIKQMVNMKPKND
tara:strand:- start:104 stop:478 length:375 start_codon:yes stop_codon:yes gene_type:complete